MKLTIRVVARKQTHGKCPLIHACRSILHSNAICDEEAYH